jgi:hypothetical protein
VVFLVSFSAPAGSPSLKPRAKASNAASADGTLASFIQTSAALGTPPELYNAMSPCTPVLSTSAWKRSITTSTCGPLICASPPNRSGSSIAELRFTNTTTPATRTAVARTTPRTARGFHLAGSRTGARTGVGASRTTPRRPRAAGGGGTVFEPRNGR